MLLSVLPDIDLGFKLLGIDPGHRTFTHSAILALIVSVAGSLYCQTTKISDISLFDSLFYAHINRGHSN